MLMGTVHTAIEACLYVQQTLCGALYALARGTACRLQTPGRLNAHMQAKDNTGCLRSQPGPCRLENN